MNTKDKRPLKSALSYAARGWPVFPLHTPTKNGCSCKKKDCKSIGKHPRTKNGHKDATTYRSFIRKWWEKWPDANVGVVTGQESGLLVLDIDSRHGGEDSLLELEQQHDELPDTAETITGGGGHHIIFAHPGSVIKSKASIRQGVDVKADGGYIVAPPSLHVSGRRYRWALSSDPKTVAIAPCPKWLLDELEGPRHEDLFKSHSRVDPTEILEGVPEGRRDIELFRYACQLRAKKMSKDEAYVLVIKAAANCSPPFPEEEALRKIESAWKYPPGKAYIEARKREQPKGYTAAELMAKELKEPYWVVPGILPEGLTLLCGKPKMGKSFAALNLAVAITIGNKALGKVDVVRGSVIYLSLEDNFKRLKQRLEKVLQGAPAPNDLYLYTSWPKVDEGGIDHFKKWIKQHPHIKLVIVDTLARIRHRPRKHGNLQLEDYLALEGFKELAEEYQLSVLVVWSEPLRLHKK